MHERETTKAASHSEPALLVFGCGYVGTAVAMRALERSWRVTALTRNAAQAAALRACGVDVVEAALESDAWHSSIPKGRFEYVLDCVSASGGGLPGYWRAYVDGTRSILRWAEAGVPAALVYTSSTSVYAASDGSTVDERSVTGTQETTEPLLMAERLFLESRSFARTFVLRLSGIYGPGRHHLLDEIRRGAELLPGTGRHRLNLVHRDDIVSAVMACFDASPQTAGGIFNVSSAVAPTKAALASWLASKVGRTPPRFAHDAGVAGTVPGVVRGRSGPVPDRVVSADRIRRELGWTPRHDDFESGYEQVFRAEGIA